MVPASLSQPLSVSIFQPLSVSISQPRHPCVQYEAWVTEATENNEGGANQDKISSIMEDLDTAKKKLIELDKDRKKEEDKMGKQTVCVEDAVLPESLSLTSNDEKDDTCIVFDTDCSGYGFIVCVSPMYPEVRFVLHLTARQTQPLCLYISAK